MARIVTSRSISHAFILLAAALALSLGTASNAAFAGDLAPATLAQGVGGGGKTLADIAGEIRNGYVALGASGDRSAVDPYEGSAYVILTDDGELVFFRSHATYSEGSGQTVVDTMGNSYTGKVYADFEDTASFNTESAVPWQSDRASVVSVRFAAGQKIKPVSCAYWFYQFGNMTSLDVSGLDTSRTVSMAKMFGYLNRSITYLDLSGFDTSHVTRMDWLFIYGSGLTSIDISGWDTSNVTDMGYMFSGCERLTSLNLADIDTSSAVSLRNMFAGVPLSAYDLSGFDTSKCKDFSYMFWGSSVREFDLTPLDTSAATDMSYMFQNCRRLETLDLSTFNTSKVTSFERMFDRCSRLSSLNLSSFDTSSAKKMNYMMSSCTSLSQLRLGPNFSFQGNGRMSNPQMVVPPTPPSDDGVHNGKWASPTSESFPQYTPEELSDSYDGSTMAGLYVWATYVYGVSFDANGGSGSMASVEVRAGESFIIPSCQFTNEGMLFNGWNSQADGSGDSYVVGENVVLTDDLVLHAQWREPRIVLDITDSLLLNASSDGTLSRAPGRSLSFSNRGDVAVRLSGLSIEPAAGVSFVAAPTRAGEFDIWFSPAGGSSVKLSDCVSPTYAELPSSGGWDVQPGVTMRITNISGVTGGINLPASSLRLSVGTIQWRFTTI